MRTLGRGWMIPVYALAVIAGVFHFYTSGFGSPEPRVFRGLHLGMLLPVIFLFYPARAKSPKNRPSIVDLAAVVLCLVATLYTVYYADRLNEHFIGFHDVRTEEVLLGALLALAVIEGCRRSMSKWYALTVSVVLIYLFTCAYWPGMFRFKAFSFDRAIEILYLPNDDGMFGFLTGISAEILFIYILFAAVLTASGAGNFLIEFASWAAGWARGGSAKISVISSALYGTVSGSSVANVYATGSFTIPMMKKSGYSPKEAAAVEAVSGVGGQIMPPIMGAGSFIMAEITGVPYFTIIKTAAIPAILYYLGVMCMVHFIAVRRGILAIRKEDRPKPRDLLRHAYFVIPFMVIVSLLATGYSPSKAAFHSIWITLILSCFDRKTWINRTKLLEIFFKSLINCALIASVLAGSGMVVGILTRTGVALSFGTILVSASKGVLLFAALLVFMVVSVLGTGIPTTASYIISITVGAQALTNFNVELLAAHLFVFYYAVLADLTPPDAVTSFAAANLAGSEPMATGIEGFRLGIAGFLVPFAFLYQPALLLKGSYLDILMAFTVTVIGIVSLACGVIGQFRTPLNWIQRAFFLSGAAFLVFPGKWNMIAGLALVISAGIWSWLGDDPKMKNEKF
ncbi:MAG: hypothetical protein COS92_02110 [Desulfobacterales bacterium CG07_land_8_20_14_0_80_52_14]|nr:MAG: hypothetical protein COX20_13705 [Desulfobacterales bacterium CG23_combo_of_CG06-09_8_20_14_all_52_9]PIU50287.1 MAG: hypothetical protein COS92_02110 [Desulfobacterales bacterium CG07_land_8_20_14_0_80_52_14]